jgi:hypothetical protein
MILLMQLSFLQSVTGAGWQAGWLVDVEQTGRWIVLLLRTVRSLQAGQAVLSRRSSKSCVQAGWQAYIAQPGFGPRSETQASHDVS